MAVNFVGVDRDTPDMFPAEPIMQTFIDRYIEQGINQGIRQGLDQGQRLGEATALLRLIERKFGPPSDSVRERMLGRVFRHRPRGTVNLPQHAPATVSVAYRARYRTATAGRRGVRLPPRQRGVESTGPDARACATRRFPPCVLRADAARGSARCFPGQVTPPRHSGRSCR
jgi:hypothetical protein